MEGGGGWGEGVSSSDDNDGGSADDDGDDGIYEVDKTTPMENIPTMMAEPTSTTIIDTFPSPWNELNISELSAS